MWMNVNSDIVEQCEKIWQTNIFQLLGADSDDWTHCGPTWLSCDFLCVFVCVQQSRCSGKSCSCAEKCLWPNWATSKMSCDGHAHDHNLALDLKHSTRLRTPPIIRLAPPTPLPAPPWVSEWRRWVNRRKINNHDKEKNRTRPLSLWTLLKTNCRLLKALKSFTVFSS